MPTQSYNSSVLTTPQQQLESASNFPANHYHNLSENDAKDWFYGTEELLDALPRVWTRSLLYLILGFAGIALPWSMLSKVDETGSARGRIEPKGSAQRLDAAVPGNIIAVKVKEGQTVAAGQVLVELESNDLRTNLQQAQTKLEGEQSRLAQLDLIKNQVMLSINVQEQQNRAQELEKMSQVQQAQQNVDAKQSTYNLQKLENQAQVDQAKQNINSTQNAYTLSKTRLSRDLAEVKRFRQLWKMGVVPQIKVVELQKLGDESQKLQIAAESEQKQANLRLKEQQSRYQAFISQIQADINQAKLRLQEQQSSYQSVIHTGQLALLKNQEQLKDLQTQIGSLKSEISQTKSQILAYNFQLDQRIVRSPIDGIIFQLPIQKPGVVVQPGQMVAQIAPKNSAFILKAQMASNQSGFLRIGMPVKTKFDAYPFQDYGIVTGRVSWISPDSKIQETNAGKIETYELDITLDNPYIQAANKRITLTPGQTATAEVVIRQRRIIDFIIDPFKKLQKGGLEL
ncbi:HlyD family secretion protein [Nostoc sp. T09]|uniref:HlyD family efflux transporter periplasmic adaptor subunit n=1 Tax=Nostoc sp. T09 TaxID=1932621 RepID=UPI000A3C77C4|nr:HlyD family efflux transporter periplasmic adaptor subunit [Nostoc sp. T09]OUL28970.1 HlyD family secretion protein [Nostoc sp. T09]